MEKKLAKITKAHLEIQERGILNFWIFVDYEEDGFSQGVGGIALDTWDEVKRKRVGSAFGAEVIRQLLLCISVNDFSEMKGKYIWVIGEGEGMQFTPKGIQSLNTEKSKGMQVVWEDILKEFGEDK